MNSLVFALALPSLLVVPDPALAQSTVLVPTQSSATDSGKALLAAVGALPSTTDPASRTRLVLEAGLYDLGAEQLLLPVHVDLTGAGSALTTIRSSWPGTDVNGGTIAVPPGIVATIRDLGIENLQTSADGIGLQTSSDGLTLERVEVRVSGTFLPLGVVVQDGSPSLTDLSIGVRASAWGASFGFRGLVVQGGAPVIDRLTVTATPAATAAPEAIVLTGGAPVLGGVTVDIEGTSIASGIIATGDTSALVTDAVLDVASAYQAMGVSTNGLAQASLGKVNSLATAGSDMGCALSTADYSSVVAVESSFVADGTSNHYGLCNRGDAEIHDSQVAGSVAIWSDDPDADAMLVTSEIHGPVVLDSGIVQCDGSLNESGALLGTSCQ